MSVADGTEDVEKMMEGGCGKCAHFHECEKDARAASGFSSTRTGRSCAGFLDRDTGETGTSSCLFADL